MFKVGETVVCINTNANNDYGLTFTSLTIGKTYVIIDQQKIHELVLIKNNRGENIFYRTNRFLSLIEYRKLKIEKICSSWRHS